MTAHATESGREERGREGLLYFDGRERGRDGETEVHLVLRLCRYRVTSSCAMRMAQRRQIKTNLTQRKIFRLFFLLIHFVHVHTLSFALQVTYVSVVVYCCYCCYVMIQFNFVAVGVSVCHLRLQ